MHYSEAKPSFLRLNSLMGQSSPAAICPFVWQDDNVVLKNVDFDEEAYRQSKITVLLLKRDSVLSTSERVSLVHKVIDENEELLLQISFASPENWKQLDTQMDYLIESAFMLAEHEAQLRISVSNIQQSRTMDDGWMSYHDVRAMLALNQHRKAVTGEPSKFVNSRV
jgi:hypothetical protein